MAANLTNDELFGFIAAALITLGGTIGFLKKRSVASLVAGGGSGAALGWGVHSGDARVVTSVSAVLFLVMGSRFAKGRKVMPAGVVTLLSGALLYRFGQRLL